MKRIPQIWRNGECWIIGGGASMPRQFGVPEEVIQQVFSKQESPAAFSSYLQPIHDRHVIGVNAAYLLGDWLDFLFFGDHKFYVAHRAKLMQYPKLKFSCHKTTVKYHKEGVRYIEKDVRHLFGISSKPNQLSWNLNSGAAAIDLAVKFGAKKIYLLGFDMNTDPKAFTHWHREYKVKKIPFRRHLQAFPAIAEDAKRMGVEIINVNRESAIKDFPKMSLKECI